MRCDAMRRHHIVSTRDPALLNHEQAACRSSLPKSDSVEGSYFGALLYLQKSENGMAGRVRCETTPIEGQTDGHVVCGTNETLSNQRR